MLLEWRVEGGGRGQKEKRMKKKGKQKSTTCVGASLTPDYRDKEASNSNPRTPE